VLLPQSKVGPRRLDASNQHQDWRESPQPVLLRRRGVLKVLRLCLADRFMHRRFASCAAASGPLIEPRAGSPLAHRPSASWSRRS
jgi:hypothetical protein